MKKILLLIIVLLLAAGFVFAGRPAELDFVEESAKNQETEKPDSSIPGHSSDLKPEPVPVPAITPAPAVTAQNIAPEAKLLSPKNNETLSGTAVIELSVNRANSVAFFAKRRGVPTAIYLGQGQLKEESQWVFSWNTLNTPNGAYVVFSEITNQHGKYKGQEINIIIQNQLPQPENLKEKIDDLKNINVQKQEIEQFIEETVQKTEERVAKEIQEIITTAQNQAPHIAEEIQKQAQQSQQDISQQVTRIAESIKQEKEIASSLAEIAKNKEERETKLNQIQQEIEAMKEINVSVLAEEVSDRVKKEKQEIAQKIAEELTEVEKQIQEAKKTAEQARAIREDSQERISKSLKQTTDRAVTELPLLEIIGVNIENIVESVKTMEKEVDRQAEAKAEFEKKMLKDSDGDGLPDFLEIEIGTDPFNPDTSGDGYLDGEVFALGLDPRVPITAVQERVVYQDPRKISPKQEDKFFIERAEVKISEITGREVLRLEGRGLPNSFVSIYIYSSPVVVTTRTDEYGRWVYELDKTMESGKHEAYVVLTGTNGEIVARSESFNFMRTGAGILQLIPDVWAQETGRESGELLSPYQSIRNSFLILTISVIVLAISIAILVIGFFTKKKAKEYLPENNTKE